MCKVCDGIEVPIPKLPVEGLNANLVLEIPNDVIIPEVDDVNPI